MPAAPLIELRDLARSYRAGEQEVRALDRVSLSIQAGEFVAIMGPSGSGKSTLMAILGCLDRPDGGHYLLKGRDVSALSEPQLAGVRNRLLGFVFQSFNLLPRTSALDNVVLPLLHDARGVASAAARRQRARLLLKLLGLREREGHTPAQLSGGQQQRVAIARALVNAPALLLADEPTGNLDSQASRDVMRILRELNRAGLTIVMVTHEPDIAAQASRVLTLRDGRILSDERRAAIAPDAQSPAWLDERVSRLSALFQRPPAGGDGTVRAGGRAAFVAMLAGAAFTAVRRNRLRSGLTMLGIFIGVAALITMIAVGEGASAAVRRQLEGLGTHLLVILPRAPDGGGAPRSGGVPVLTEADATAIERNVPALAEVGYGMQQFGPVYSLGRSTLSTLQGVSLRYPELLQWRLVRGRSFSEAEETGAELVCLIGQTVYRRLFDATQNPVGAIILVRGAPLRVIGLLASKGQTAYGTDQDDLVMMPFATAERRVLGAATPGGALAPPQVPTPTNPLGVPPHLSGQVHVIYASALSEQGVEAAADQATQALRQHRGLRSGQAQDFSVGNLSQIVEAAKGGSRVMTLMLSAVASISLLVGGIGIMNILLVSVTERTREIGLRMAIGARRRQVLLQFLAEATLLSTLGGLAGIGAGVAAAAAVSAFAGWPTQVSAASVVGGFIFSAAVGLVFGVVPARKAAALEPMQAMRHE